MTLPSQARDPFAKQTEPPAPPEKPDPFDALVKATEARPSPPPSAPTRFAQRLPAAHFKKRVEARPRPATIMYRNIPPHLHQRLKTRAADVGIPVGELVRYFFEQGLTAMRTQALELQPQLRPVGLTLYPHEKRGRTPKGKGTSRKHRAAYRGIPAALHAQMKTTASHLGVPHWQLARRFMEYGLAEIPLAHLKQCAQPSPQVTLTLYPGEGA